MRLSEIHEITIAISRTLQLIQASTICHAKLASQLSRLFSNLGGTCKEDVRIDLIICVIRARVCIIQKKTIEFKPTSRVHHVH